MAVYQSFKERLDLKADSSVSVYDVNSLRRVKVSVIRVSIVLVIVVVLDVLVEAPKRYRPLILSVLEGWPA